MLRNSRYSPELRKRAVRMSIETRSTYPSEWATFSAVSKVFGMSPETLKSWVCHISKNFRAIYRSRSYVTN
jgi:transposase